MATERIDVRPPTETAARDLPELETCREALTKIFGPPESRGFRVRFWNGVEEPEGSSGAEGFTLGLRWPGALRSMLVPPTDRAVGEAYVRGEVELDGDLEEGIEAGIDALRGIRFPGGWLRLWSLLRRLPSRPRKGSRTPEGWERLEPHSHGRMHTRERDSEAVRFHYDLPAEFYRLFLDPYMQYSCGFFETPETSLEDAEIAKLEMICRKLELRPGDELLDVGCGWGGLIRYAVEHYGVRATGLTLSPEQAEFARRTAREKGIEDRCRIEIRDYRDLEGRDRFDKAVSVGMIEHVGLANYPDYFSTIQRVLKPGGRFVNQGIVAQERGYSALDRIRLRIERSYGSFIHHHVFPDSDLVPSGRTQEEAERAGLVMQSAVNIGPHYAETLRRWLDRLEERHEEAASLAGEATYRAWRFYIGASVVLFQSGYLGVLQALFRTPAPA